MDYQLQIRKLPKRFRDGADCGLDGIDNLNYNLGFITIP